MIGPSLVNFTLNGLENIVNFSKFTFVPEKNVIYNNLARELTSAKIVRYAEDFIIVTNSLEFVTILKKNVENFLQQRGLIINKKKSLITKWVKNSKFNYLGFTLHCIRIVYKSKDTILKRKTGQITSRNRLYIYPSIKSVNRFKIKIKNVVKKNFNLPPYKLILLLNPIIKS